MSAPVDVLADAARELESNLPDAGLGLTLAEELRAYRAAVAEMVEAAKRVNADHMAPHDCYATGPITGDPIRDLVSCPGCELAAALSKFGGGQ